MVAQLPNYRLYTIYKLPCLRTLDFLKVTHKERLAARTYFESVHGQAILKEIESGKIAVEGFAAKKDKQQTLAGKKRSAIEVERERKIEQISNLIDQATSMEEVKALQKQLEMLQDEEDDDQ